MQLVKPRARWLHSGCVMVTHPSPRDGWVSFDTCLDRALKHWYECTLNDMVKPQPVGKVIYGRQ